MDPDPSIFIIDLQDANKKMILKKKFCCILLFKSTVTSFYQDKKSKNSQNNRNQDFSDYFLLNDRRIRIRIHASD